MVAHFVTARTGLSAEADSVSGSHRHNCGPEEARRVGLGHGGGGEEKEERTGRQEREGSSWTLVGLSASLCPRRQPSFAPEQNNRTT